MFERVKKTFTRAVNSIFHIYPSISSNIAVQELLDFDSDVAVNKIWYRGDSYELIQLYKQIADNAYTFWGSVPTRGLEIRKVHTGLPKTIINVLTSCVCDDLQDVKFGDLAAETQWSEMCSDSDFDKVVKTAVKDTLVTGDGAFKIAINTDVSQYPIIEFYEADRIDIVREHGFVKEIIFKTLRDVHGGTGILKEHYGRGYIHYELTDSLNNPIDLSRLPDADRLQDVYWQGDFMLAEYMSFYESEKFKGRGQSVFDAKRDNFDALDETWSQWIDALRAGRTRTYIPENLLPRNPKTGELMRGNSFDNRFIALAASTSETDNGRIQTESAEIQHEGYLSTYVTALDLCLQGIISPSTLGIDTKKLDNAEAQREKEKTTLYTRQTIVTELQRVLPLLIQDVFYAYQTLTRQPVQRIDDIDVPFGEYANPSFESQVETVGKAKTQGVMSVKAAIDELYGDSKSDEWKEEELRRIYNEQGIAELDETAASMDASGANFENTQQEI